MEYLPTFGSFFGYMYVKIPYMEHLGYVKSLFFPHIIFVMRVGGRELLVASPIANGVLFSWPRLHRSTFETGTRFFGIPEILTPADFGSASLYLTV